MASRLVVKITHAHGDTERAHMAVNVAATAVASGLMVEVFLAGDGVELALPGTTFTLAEAPPVHELLDILFDGAAVTVCAPCAARRGYGADDFRDGVALAGSAAFVAAATQPDTTALVY